MFSIMIHPPKIKQVHSIKYKFRGIIYNIPHAKNAEQHSIRTIFSKLYSLIPYTHGKS